MVHLNGGGYSFFPCVRSIRAVDSFVFTGNTVNGTLDIVGALFCPHAGENPNREGAGAVANAVPVVGSQLVVACYSTAAGGAVKINLAFVGGGAPSFRTVWTQTIGALFGTLLDLVFPVVPAIQISITASAVAPFELAASWQSAK